MRKKASHAPPGSGTLASAWIRGYRVCYDGCHPASANSRKDLRAQQARHIETRDHKGDFVGDLERFGVAGFTLDIAWQRVYERCCLVAPHIPEAHEEIERKIGQSLARCRLTELAA